MSFRSGHLEIHASDILSKIAANWRDLAAQYFTNQKALSLNVSLWNILY